MNADFVNEYEILSSPFAGFSLGYYKFFMMFECKYYSQGLSGLCWADKILTCGTEHVYGDGRKSVEKLIMDFQREQIRWIRSAEIQAEMEVNPEGMRTECLRRMTFFIAKLRETIGKGFDGKADSHLREIRKMAYFHLNLNPDIRNIDQSS